MRVVSYSFEMSNSEAGSGGVQSVDRAVTILEIIARTGLAGITEIAGELGVHKSTASRVVSTLEARGLVDHFGGALGVSRVVTGLGWRPHAEQVGQTGSSISGDVYIACGISGAIQHMAGIEGAKTLVAINTDEEAAMVQRADYAVIGDLHEVVGAVNEEIVRRRG